MKFCITVLIKNLYSKAILKLLASFQYIKVYEKILEEKIFKKMAKNFYKTSHRMKISKFNFMALIEVQMREEYFFVQLSIVENNSNTLGI